MLFRSYPNILIPVKPKSMP